MHVSQVFNESQYLLYTKHTGHAVDGEVHVQTVELDVNNLGANRAPFLWKLRARANF